MPSTLALRPTATSAAAARSSVPSSSSAEMPARQSVMRLIRRPRWSFTPRWRRLSAAAAAASASRPGRSVSSISTSVVAMPSSA
ncbi:MAG: hypothetical protein J7M21_02435 [Planctomycetes bacterium]|nr:hypothetical protein [Planctomycetota bacterium]